MASERSNDFHGTKSLPVRVRHPIANSDNSGGTEEGLSDSGTHSRKKRRQDSDQPRDVNPGANANKKHKAEATDSKDDHVEIPMNRYQIEGRDNFLIITKDLSTQENLAPLKEIERTREYAEELESLRKKIQECNDFAKYGKLVVRVVRLREAIAREQKVNSQVPEFWAIEDIDD